MSKVEHDKSVAGYFQKFVVTTCDDTLLLMLGIQARLIDERMKDHNLFPVEYKDRYDGKLPILLCGFAHLSSSFHGNGWNAMVAKVYGVKNTFALLRFKNEYHGLVDVSITFFPFEVDTSGRAVQDHLKGKFLTLAISILEKKGLQGMWTEKNLEDAFATTWKIDINKNEALGILEKLEEYHVLFRRGDVYKLCLGIDFRFVCNCFDVADIVWRHRAKDREEALRLRKSVLEEQLRNLDEKTAPAMLLYESGAVDRTSDGLKAVVRLIAKRAEDAGCNIPGSSLSIIRNPKSTTLAGINRALWRILSANPSGEKNEKVLDVMNDIRVARSLILGTIGN